MTSAPNIGGTRSRSVAYASAPQPLETIVGPTRVALERASIRFLLMRRLPAVPGSLIDRKTRLVKDNVRSTCRVVPRERGRWLCIVRPPGARGKTGAYIAYRVVRGRLARPAWLGYRRR